MERKTRKKLAAVLVFFMLFSILPTAVFAAPAEQNQGIELQPYTSMEDLMQKASAELVASGTVAEEITASQDLVQAVEAQTETSFGEVETAIMTGLITNYDEGVVDTAKYGLDDTVMQDMMDYILQQSYLTNDVTYSYNAQTGTIQFKMSDSKAAALDSWNKMWEETVNNVDLQPAIATASEEANAPKISLFALGDEYSQGGHKGTCTSPSSLLFKDGEVTSVNFHWQQTAETIATADDAKNGMLVYDAETDSIVAADKLKYSWEFESADYICPSCGETITFDSNDVEISTQSVWANKVTGDQYYSEEQIGQLPEEEQKNVIPVMTFKMVYLLANGGKIPVLTETGEQLIDQNGQLVFACNDPNQFEGNDSALDAFMGYQQMTALIKGKSECFGISTPYWTSKATAGNPFGALKVVLNMEEDDPDVPAMFAQYIPELTKGFAALVYYYEDALLAIAEGAQKLMNRDDVQALTDEYKLLLLHDWLANNAVFDMGSLVASREEGHGGAVGLESLLGMTPFTMLSTAIGYNGGVCLGYTASYAYIVQNAFADNYYETDMTTLMDKGNKEKGVHEVIKKDPTHMVDFVKIRFHSNVAESSVAGPDSGWGDDAWFNEPHFFNAVQLNNAVAGNRNWFYVDPCYDDASSEVISQYRAETDGNISHMYFLAAPSTIQDQFEGNCDYIDSLYDGGIYQLPDELTAEEYKTQVENGDREAGWTFVETEEVGYTDTTYEEAWFSNAQSEIILHDDNWYYVEGLNAYNSMKDMMGDMGDMGDFMDQFQDQFQQQQSDPKYAHELKRRPVSKNSNLTGTVMSGEGMNMSLKEDKYAYGLYHYGYGYFDYGLGAADENTNANKAFEADLDDDQTFRDMYPELSHSIGLYEGELYFNLGNKILSYNLRQNTVAQVKEYNDVNAEVVKDKHQDENGNVIETEKAFKASAFRLTETTPSAYSFRYRPIAGLSVKDKAMMDENGQLVIKPTMTVSVGTNLTESYKDENGDNYTEEALNFNPNYQRFMDDDKTDGENTNTEFMWCANLVGDMDMATLSAELQDSAETEEVTVAAYCDKNEFTETRTANYGLSDGTTKTETENTALKHKYVAHDGIGAEGETVYVCKICNACTTEAPAAILGDVNSDGEVNMKDVTRLVKYLNEQPVDIDMTAADTNGDEVVNMKDLTRLLKHLNDSSVSLG